MTRDAVLREVELTLPMVADMEILATKIATAMAEFMEMSPDRIDEVRMAVVEACINAFEHSRSNDRKAYLTFAILGADKPEKLRITVEDKGIGFDPSEVEEPLIGDKITAERKRGWGIKIIEGLMDEVSFASGAGGTTVVMSKTR